MQTKRKTSPRPLIKQPTQLTWGQSMADSVTAVRLSHNHWQQFCRVKDDTNRKQQVVSNAHLAQHTDEIYTATQAPNLMHGCFHLKPSILYHKL